MLTLVVFDAIKNRRSIREYLDVDINTDIINKLIESAISAPSGKNLQPWRFRIVTNKQEIQNLSKLSKNEKWMQLAPCFFLCFLDKKVSYNYIKDVQSCGAAIQNVLLCSYSFGIGSCWIGDIIEYSNEVKKILMIDEPYLELMGLVALGYYDDTKVIRQKRYDKNHFII